MHECERKLKPGIEVFSRTGCQLVEIRMPHTDYASATYYNYKNIIATAEVEFQPGSCMTACATRFARLMTKFPAASIARRGVR